MKVPVGLRPRTLVGRADMGSACDWAQSTPDRIRPGRSPAEGRLDLIGEVTYEAGVGGACSAIVSRLFVRAPTKSAANPITFHML